MNIGKRLRNIRNHRNMTQQELGVKIGNITIKGSDFYG